MQSGRAKYEYKAKFLYLTIYLKEVTHDNDDDVIVGAVRLAWYHGAPWRQSEGAATFLQDSLRDVVRRSLVDADAQFRSGHVDCAFSRYERRHQHSG